MIIAKKKLCVVTGSRADYGLLKYLIKSLSNSNAFKLQLVLTGSHLSEKFGNTFKEVVADGFFVDEMVDINAKGGRPSDSAKSTAIAIEGFSKAFENLDPDLVIILGDRYELLGVAIAAMFHGYPMAHFHGGEVTRGAIDDGIRHALTKLSHIHFVASEEYRNRVIQMGENPEYVFNIGGLGVDAIKRVSLMTRKEIEKDLGFSFKDKNLLITFHPVTLERRSSSEQMKQLLAALESHEDKQLIFTMPNADTDSMEIFDLIE